MVSSWTDYRSASMTRPLRTLLAVLLVAALAGPATAGATAPAAPTPTPIRLWFTGGEQFSVVNRTIQTYRTKALPTINALLRGPTSPERAQNIATQIPAGVRVVRLTLSGSAAVLELSPEFLKGIPRTGRSDAQEISLNARLGQVIYTLTQFSQITSAKVLSDGQLLSLQSPKTQAPTPQGTLGRKDFTKPIGAAPPTVTPPSAPSPSPSPTAPPAGTKELQQRLADLGFLPAGAVDGVAGYQTQQAVLAFQAWHGLQRDGVAGPLTRQVLQKAGRPQSRGGGPAKRMEVYRDKGVLLLISGGRVTRAIHVSSGGPATPTPSGTYRIFRKELQSWSVPFSVYLPYASYFNNGIAFHEYPEVPAFPASHGCVRVPAPEAKGVYAFAANGTAVIVR